MSSSPRTRGRGRGRGRPRSQQQKLQSLRVSPQDHTNSTMTDRSQWVNICRAELLDMETKNIDRRAVHWTELVNNKVRDTNRRLSLDEKIFRAATKPFAYTVSDEAMSKHLNFIITWTGLKQRQIQSAPKTFTEYKNKAQNWLNGRRAPNYAATLFPDMIKASEIYAHNISRQIFANNPKHSKMYCRICTIGFLSALCSARISLNDASKKAYLICENSVKTGKTQVSQILQRYAQDHPYQDKFPSHLREASDYFEAKYMELVSDFAIQLNQKNRQDKLLYANTTGKQVLEIINNDSPTSDNVSHRDSGSVHSNSSLPTDTNHQSSGGGLPPTVTHSLLKDITNCDGNLNAISMSIDQFNKLAEFLKGMISNQKTQQETIEDLVNRVQTLETQQQKILNDVTSNSNNSSPRTGFNTTPPYLQQQNTNTSSNTSSVSMVPPYAPNMNGIQQQPVGHHLGMNGHNYSQPRPQFINASQTANNHATANQGGSSPSTKTTTSTASLPSNTQNFMNGMASHMNHSHHNGNGHGIDMRAHDANHHNNHSNNMNNMNMSMNLNHNNANHMNNGNNHHNNHHMLRMPMNLMNNNGFNMPQLTNPALNPIPVPPPQQQQQQQQHPLLPPPMNVAPSYTDNNNNHNHVTNTNHDLRDNSTVDSSNNTNNSTTDHSNTAIPPGIAGAAAPAANMSVHLQPTNTLNTSLLPSTSLNGGLMSFGSEDENKLFGICNSQSFNSSDAGMTNMLSIPNNLNQLSSHQIPLDSGGFRFSDQSINFSNQYNS